DPGAGAGAGAGGLAAGDGEFAGVAGVVGVLDGQGVAGRQVDPGESVGDVADGELVALQVQDEGRGGGGGGGDHQWGVAGEGLVVGVCAGEVDGELDRGAGAGGRQV